MSKSGQLIKMSRMHYDVLSDPTVLCPLLLRSFSLEFAVTAIDLSIGIIRV
jgi:hypothetical protein